MDGTFLLADISGHSAYLDEAGLRHASTVTAKLLNALIEANRKPWKVANLEGDAVFFVAPERPAPDALLAHVRTLFDAFFARVLDVSEDVDCGCGACGGANRLALKFIVHAGEYEERIIGGRRELIGPDVVVAHRLLKPDVPSPEFVLLTRAYLGDRPVPGLPARDGTVQLPDAVPFVVADLAPLRQESEATTGRFVSEREALARFEVEVDAPAEAVWNALVDVGEVRRWTGSREILEFPSRTGPVGTAYRWILTDGSEFGRVLLAMDETGRRLTLRQADVAKVGRLFFTYEVSAGAVRCLVRAERRRRLTGRATSRALGKTLGFAESELARLKSYCERPAASPRG